MPSADHPARPTLVWANQASPRTNGHKSGVGAERALRRRRQDGQLFHALT